MYLCDGIERHFYYNSDGEFDEIAAALDDCVAQSAYVILKNISDLNKNLYYAFISELTIRLSVKNNNYITSFGALGEITDKNMIEIVTEKVTKNDIKDKLITYIKHDRFPLVRGTIEYLKSFIFYNEKYLPAHNGKSKHSILFIGEKDGDFFYVDSPGVIAYENYQYYNDNLDIGVMKSEDFEKFIKDGCELIYYIFDNDAINASISKVNESIKNSCLNFNKSSFSENDVVHFFGIEAIEKFFQLILERKISLHDLTVTQDRNMMSYISWRMSVIKGRRKLLKIYMEEKKENAIAKDLESLVFLWEMFHSLLYKSYLNNSDYSDRIKKLSEQIIVLEKQINKDLENYLIYH